MNSEEIIGMLPIYTSNQLKSWDQQTIQREGIDSYDLMERAAKQFVNWFRNIYQNNQRIIVFCGNGNNGGDGLAIARLLHMSAYRVAVVLIKFAKDNSSEYTKNLTKIDSLNIEILNSKNQVNEIIHKSSNLVIIDAISGYGLNRTLDSEVLKWVQLINQSGCKINSVDVPSGMHVDKMTFDECIHADCTFSFQVPKLCHLIAETGRFCGIVKIGNIDLDPEFVKQNHTLHNYLELNDIKEIYKPRNPFDWKNKFGHLLIVGGNNGMVGAILLAATASLRSGCGLCSISAEELNREIIQISLPEAIYVPENKMDVTKYSSLLIGPGMGMENKSRDHLKHFLKNFDKPIVLDADALNIIAMEKWHASLNNNCILTPHVGEFDRLFGTCSNGFERLNKAMVVSSELGIHIILKGKNSAIISPDEGVYFNSTGNPGLAKGGSGDVLSGMLAAFLTQGYPVLEACKIAVYLHGLSADIAKEELAEESIFPSDIIHNISKAFKRISI